MLLHCAHFREEKVRRRREGEREEDEGGKAGREGGREEGMDRLETAT